MAKDPAFLFYYADAASDVSHMNRLERGCYFDFLQAQKKFGPLTLESIQKILGKDFETCWQSLKMCLTYVNDMYYIAWLQDSIEKRKNYSASRAKNRKGLNNQKNEEEGSTYVNHMVNENVNTIVNVNTDKGVQGEIPKLQPKPSKDPGPDFTDYEAWTKSVVENKDHIFEQMLMGEGLKPNGQLVTLARDHLQLLARYSKTMRPQSQQTFRYSLIKSITENLNKKTHDTKPNQRPAIDFSPGKDFGKF
jgi:hypothetical protein